MLRLEHMSLSTYIATQVFLWSIGVSEQPELLWHGNASDLCGVADQPCDIGALALWSLTA